MDCSIRHARLEFYAPVKERVQENPHLAQTSVWYVHLEDLPDGSAILRAL